MKGVFLRMSSQFFVYILEKMKRNYACMYKRERERLQSPSEQYIHSLTLHHFHLHVSHFFIYAEQMVAIAAVTPEHVFTFTEFVVIFKR